MRLRVRHSALPKPVVRAVGLVLALVVFAGVYYHLLPPTATIPATCIPSQDVLFVTSITRPFRDHAASRNYHKTIWQALSSQFPLWVYNENTWEVLHNRQPLEATDLPFGECMLDVFKVSPVLNQHTLQIDQFYEIAGTPGLNERIMDGKVLVRKVAAIHHALHSAKDGTLVVWLDVDVVFTKLPWSEMLSRFVLDRDVNYLAETTCWRTAREVGSYAALPDECLDFRVDTGIVVFRAGEVTRRFATWWLDAYSGPMLALAKLCFENQPPSNPQHLVEFFTGSQSRHAGKINSPQDLCNLKYIRSSLGLNDIHTFALGLHAFGSELRHGWLAYKTTGCRPVETDKLPGGHCHPCKSPLAAKGGLVSEFCLCDYLIHVKGGSAIMARQHTVRQEKELKQVKTTDQELLLPANLARCTV
ncbi:hypothetical protein BASA81_003971 [Batrachochytrium salamandrivorans]|nr:hypothetical protein BASA81_003971 [Batrachochytrium salamandrivorans]